MQETQVQSLSWEDPLEKEMAAHSSTLAWRIPWGRSLVGYSPWGRKESDTTERLHSLTHSLTHSVIKKKKGNILELYVLIWFGSKIFNQAYIFMCTCVYVCDYCCFQLLLRIKYALFSVLFIHFGIFLREEKEKCPVSAACVKHSWLILKLEIFMTEFIKFIEFNMESFQPKKMYTWENISALSLRSEWIGIYWVEPNKWD